MKKIVFLLLAAGILWSCNSKQNSENKGIVNLNDTAPAHHESNTEKLQLNNEAKWKADSVTNNNVKELKAILGEFDKGGDKTLPGYHKAGKELQKGIAKMINECRMKGADHDELHKWLQPLLQDANELSKSSATTGAAEILENINSQLNLYYQYFE